MLDHLDLNVGDLARSRAFYEPLLARLGYVPFDAGDGWCSFIDPTRTFYLVLVQTSLQQMRAGYHRKRVGVNHLAFAAATPALVDDMHAWALSQALPVLYDGPMQMGDRYALFLEDPDRVKIEIVHRPR
jgi:catechol 2,3-dioxygenase-like lactoylglutathione lyase family enzyme